MKRILPLFRTWLPLLTAIVSLTSCAQPEHSPFQGYVEGEYVYVASNAAGRLISLAVTRGESVRVDQPLFALELEPQSSNLTEAREQLARAQARLEDQRKGARESELAAIKARIHEAQVALDLAAKELKRGNQLRERHVISAEDLDRRKSDRDRAKKNVEELQASLVTARLGAREGAIHAAEASVAAAQAAVTRAEWAVEDKRPRAKRAAFVFDTFYQAGERVAAGSPVVALLPPENRKIRFFIPENLVSYFAVGNTVRVVAEGVREPIHATIRYIAPQVEFTPPVIYSQETRAKLVRMIEAYPSASAATLLTVGQPVEVTLE